MPAALGTVASHRTAVATGPPLTGLQLWLDADDVSTITDVSGRVEEWRDKSGNSRHAVTAVPATGPFHNGVINGRTAIRIQPATYRVEVPAFAVAYTAAELFVVIDVTTDQSGNYLGWWGTATEWSHYTAGGVIYEGWGTTGRKALGNPVTDLLNPHIYNLRTAAGSYVAKINDEALYTDASNTVGFRATAYHIPQDNNSGDGLLGELVMYDRVLSTGDRSQVVVYLKTKWGIP